MHGQRVAGCSPPGVERGVRGRGLGGPLCTGVSPEPWHVSSSVCLSSAVLTAAASLPPAFKSHILR